MVATMGRSARAWLIMVLACASAAHADSFASAPARGLVPRSTSTSTSTSSLSSSHRRRSTRRRSFKGDNVADLTDATPAGASANDDAVPSSVLRRAVLGRWGGASAAGEGGGSVQRWLGLPLPQLLLGLLVVHKCGTDSLSRFTRSTGVPYSATTVAILGELIKVPILTLAICTFEGGAAGLKPVLKQALTDSPFQLALPGLAYASQNILYFMALSHVSAASYQLLSQTKLLFTGFFMSLLLDKRLNKSQLLALLLLMGGTILTQLSEVSRSTQVGAGGNALLGGALTIGGAALSALPNVYYEKVLKKKGENQWVRNVQLTFWISVFLFMFGAPAMFQSLAGPETVSLDGMLRGVTPWVYVVTVLQGVKCLIIPATLKHADNILYSYTKPAAILLTAALTAVATGIAPAPQFLAGGALVVASMVLWDS